MAVTYIKIGSTVTVGSGGSSSIAFSSIPATYTDLIVKFSGRTNYTGAPNDGVKLAFNGSTSNFTTRFIFGNGSVANSNTSTDYTAGVTGSNSTTASTFGSGEIYIPNYAGAENKSVIVDTVTEDNATNALQLIGATNWSITSAITSITLTTSFGTLWNEFSTASLYGIKKN
jgi:hypothetical protein